VLLRLLVIILFYFIFIFYVYLDWRLSRPMSPSCESRVTVVLRWTVASVRALP
jgi:hypothetical protein